MKHIHTFYQHINESQLEIESTNLPDGVKEIDEEELKKWGKKPHKFLPSGMMKHLNSLKIGLE